MRPELRTSQMTVRPVGVQIRMVAAGLGNHARWECGGVVRALHPELWTVCACSASILGSGLTLLGLARRRTAQS